MNRAKAKISKHLKKAGLIGMIAISIVGGLIALMANDGELVNDIIDTYIWLWAAYVLASIIWMTIEDLKIKAPDGKKR